MATLQDEARWYGVQVEWEKLEPLLQYMETQAAAYHSRLLQIATFEDSEVREGLDPTYWEGELQRAKEMMQMFAELILSGRKLSELLVREDPSGTMLTSLDPGLPTRIANALRAREIVTVEALTSTPRDRLLAIHGLGPGTLDKIADVLALNGIEALWKE